MGFETIRQRSVLEEVYGRLRKSPVLCTAAARPDLPCAPSPRLDCRSSGAVPLVVSSAIRLTRAVHSAPRCNLNPPQL